MKKAIHSDKQLIVDILASAFDDNKSVNYIIKQDQSRNERIRRLCSYSFEICSRFGETYISDDGKACALIIFPDKKKSTIESVCLDMKLVANVIGWPNLKKAMKREAVIKKVQPATLLYHIWYIGVNPTEQGKGIGTSLLKQILERANELKRTPILETSTEKNLPWYRKHGFRIYNKLDFGFPLYCLKI